MDQIHESTLVDLPTELLLTIFQYLTTKNLLNIAKLCHQLNVVAMLVLMEQMGFTDPHKSCVLSGRDQTDELSALSINFSLVSTQQLCVNLSDSITNIRRVNHLIHRLSPVSSITIGIVSWDNQWSLYSPPVQDFIVAVKDLVQTSISKSCSSFRLLHLHPRSMGTRLAPEERIRLDHQAIPHLISVNSRLTRLDLTSEFLLMPPFSTWTFGIMKSSPITSLTLSLPRSMTGEDFQSSLFPHIVVAIPKLEEIRLANLSNKFMLTIIENLSKFPLLRSITFQLLYFGPFYLASSPTAHIGLPHLTSFTGSSDQAAYLFGQPGISCPSLEFVNIIIHMGFQHKPDYTLKAFAPHITILNTRFFEMDIRPCITVCLSNEGRHPNLSMMSDKQRGEHSEPFNAVSRLTLELPSAAQAISKDKIPDQVNHVLAWLDIFRGLKGLTLLGHRTEVNPLAQEVRRSTILPAINAKYPDIVTFDIVDLQDSPAKYHYHWSKARGNRETTWIASTSFPEYGKSPEHSVCSQFDIKA